MKYFYKGKLDWDERSSAGRYVKENCKALKVTTGIFPRLILVASFPVYNFFLALVTCCIVSRVLSFSGACYLLHRFPRLLLTGGAFSRAFHACHWLVIFTHLTFRGLLSPFLRFLCLEPELGTNLLFLSLIEIGLFVSRVIKVRHVWFSNIHPRTDHTYMYECFVLFLHRSTSVEMEKHTNSSSTLWSTFWNMNPRSDWLQEKPSTTPSSLAWTCLTRLATDILTARVDD